MWFLVDSWNATFSWPCQFSYSPPPLNFHPFAHHTATVLPSWGVCKHIVSGIWLTILFSWQTLLNNQSLLSWLKCWNSFSGQDGSVYLNFQRCCMYLSAEKLDPNLYTAEKPQLGLVLIHGVPSRKHKLNILNWTFIFQWYFL